MKPLSRRTCLYLGCAAAALAATPEAATAQAFDATPAVRAGSVMFDRTTPGTETITVSSPSAIIDWRTFVNTSAPTPDPLTFLPAGNTATFQNGSTNADFAVLNRIIPQGTSRIRMDGAVIGRLQAAGGSIPGGTIIFSSPTGLIIGRTATFDVGNLMLTTLEPVLDTSDQFFLGGSITLTDGQLFPTAAVVIEAGAQILAPSENSWVALVAPRVEHGGSVRVNGSAAYVAAEAVSLRIDQGLFDINIAVGTNEATPIVHSGTTGGPASSSLADNHIIAMAAAPQNTAITMLLSGSAGFDPAASASVENGTIVLSAGHAVSGRNIEAFPSSETAATVRIASGSFSSDVIGRARTDFLIGTEGAGNIRFDQDLNVSALGRAELAAGGSFVTSVGGNAIVSASNLAPVAFGAAIDVTGGTASISAGSGSRVTIGGTAVVDASARGSADDQGNAGSGTGGSASVTSDKGAIEIGGVLRVGATGAGGVDPQGNIPSAGGAGTGGSATMLATNGGTISVAGPAAFDAGGTGSTSSGAVAGPGGAGTGGTASVTSMAGGSITIGGPTLLSADGTGGQVLGNSAASSGGTGQGGSATLIASSGNAVLTGGVQLSSDGAGGTGPAGGIGRGGSSLIRVGSAQLTIGPASSATSSGDGGDASVAGAPAGSGTGGNSTMLLGSGDGSTRLIGQDLALSANGSGGDGADGNDSTGAGRGGDATGGTAAITVGSRAALALGATSLSATGLGGNGGNGGLDGAGPGLRSRGGDGGTARGGSATVATIGAPVPSASGGAALSDVLLDARAVGGTAGDGSAQGGDAFGGRAVLDAAEAPIAVGGAVMMNADATAGGWLRRFPFRIGGDGVNGSATGGELSVSAGPFSASGPAGSINAGSIGGSASAFDAAPSAANVAGRWQIGTSDGGSVTAATMNFTSAVTGIPTGTPASRLQPLGGSIVAAGSGSFVSAGDLEVFAGGNGSVRGGDLSFRSCRDILLTHAARPAAIATIEGASLLFRAARTYSAPVSTLVRGSSIDIGAGLDAILGPTASSGPLTVTAARTTTIDAPATGTAISVASGDVSLTAAGRLDAGSGAVTVNAAGSYSAVPGSSVAGGSVAIRAGTSATLAATSATTTLGVNAGTTATAAGPLRGRDIAVTAVEDVVVASGGSVGDAGTATVLLQAGRDYSAASGTTVRAGTVDIRAGRDATLEQSTGGASLVVDAGGNATVKAAATGGNLRVVAARDVTVAAGGSIGDAATTSTLVQAGRDYVAAAGTTVRGNSVEIRAGGNATLAQTTGGASLAVNAGGTATVNAAATAGNVGIVAQDVVIAAGGSVGDSATQTVLLQAGRDYAAAAATTVRGNSVDIRAGRDATLATTNVAGSLAVTAGGTARFPAAATGTQISVSSGEIDLPTGGSIGGAGTTQVVLQVQPNAAATSLGGSTQGPGYTLTQAEAGRIQSNLLRVTAPGGPLGPAASAAIVVRDLSLAAAAVGAFEVATPGTVRVDGALLLANAGAANRIGIAAEGRIDVAAPGGGVRVRDASGAPAGTLTLAAPNIWVADAALLAQLAADPAFAGRDSALRTNGGADMPRGSIEAGGVTLAPRASLFVQNSGTALQYAGITVGAGGLTIRPSGNGPAAVYAFGRRLHPDGSFTTNIPFFREVDFALATSAGYTNASEFNRCLIVSGRCGGGFPGAGPTPRDILIDAFPIPPQAPPGPPLEETAFSAEPLIEEPVTSGADSTLWIGDDDDDDDEDEEQ